MSIEKITNKIIIDAEKEAEAAREAAKAEALQIIEAAKEKGRALIEEAKSKGALEEELAVSRRKSVADIDCRKLILEEKQSIIDECFDNAKKALIEDKEAYVEFLKGIVLGAGVKTGEIILNDRDKAAAGEYLLQVLKKEIPSSDFVISDETRKIEGGLLIKSGKVYINGSLEGYANEAREDLAAEIAKQLFK